MVLFFYKLKTLILSGKLPCTVDECTSLAAIQLRIYELTCANESEVDDLKKNSSPCLDTQDYLCSLCLSPDAHKKFLGRSQLLPELYRKSSKLMKLIKVNISKKNNLTKIKNKFFSAKERKTVKDILLQQRAQIKRSLCEICKEYLQLRRSIIQSTRNSSRFR